MNADDLLELAEDPRFIEGIYNYCDRWCERCAFTERCSLIAVQRALALCADDDAEAMETATEERDRRGQAHDARVDATSIMQTARAYTVLAARWLRVESGSIKGQAGTGVRDARAGNNIPFGPPAANTNPA